MPEGRRPRLAYLKRSSTSIQTLLANINPPAGVHERVLGLKMYLTRVLALCAELCLVCQHGTAWSIRPNFQKNHTVRRDELSVLITTQEWLLAKRAHFADIQRCPDALRVLRTKPRRCHTLACVEACREWIL